MCILFHFNITLEVALDLFYDKLRNEGMCICELTRYKEFCRCKKENRRSNLPYIQFTLSRSVLNLRLSNSLVPYRYRLVNAMKQMLFSYSRKYPPFIRIRFFIFRLRKLAGLFFLFFPLPATFLVYLFFYFIIWWGGSYEASYYAVFFTPLSLPLPYFKYSPYKRLIKHSPLHSAFG